MNNNCRVINNQGPFSLLDYAKTDYELGGKSKLERPKETRNYSFDDMNCYLI